MSGVSFSRQTYSTQRYLADNWDNWTPKHFLVALRIYPDTL